MAYDALWVCRGLQRAPNGVTAAELHLFAYLACLMSVYDGRSVGDWGYTFTATPAGAPFARALAEMSDRLVARGLIVHRPAPRSRTASAAVLASAQVVPAVLQVSEAGANELSLLASLASCRQRERYLEAATSAARLMPLPSVSDAVTYEPNLRRALNRVAKTELLDEDGVAVLQEQFEAVAEALRERAGGGSDLLVPTAVWVTFLAETADAERAAA